MVASSCSKFGTIRTGKYMRNNLDVTFFVDHIFNFLDEVTTWAIHYNYFLFKTEESDDNNDCF